MKQTANILLIVTLSVTFSFLLAGCAPSDYNRQMGRIQEDTQPAKPAVPYYEIVNRKNAGGNITVDLYSNVKVDAEMIVLADELLNKFDTDTTQILWVRVFDNSNIAKTYNEKIFTVNDQEAGRLQSHWNYQLKINKNTDLKELTKNVKNEWKVIKTY